MSDDELLAKGKLANVAQQVASLCEGDTFTIECPYCGKISIQDGNFCCTTLKKAVKAVLDAREKFSRAAITNHWVN